MWNRWRKPFTTITRVWGRGDGWDIVYVWAAWFTRSHCDWYCSNRCYHLPYHLIKHQGITSNLDSALWIKLFEVTELFARYLKREVKLTKHVLWQPPAAKAGGSRLFHLAWFISYPRDYPLSLLRVCLHFRWVIAFRLDPVSFSGGGNKHCAWSHSRENMNPKNNRRVLFNFFSQ